MVDGTVADVVLSSPLSLIDVDGREAFYDGDTSTTFLDRNVSEG